MSEHVESLAAGQCGSGALLCSSTRFLNTVPTDYDPSNEYNKKLCEDYPKNLHEVAAEINLAKHIYGTVIPGKHTVSGNHNLGVQDYLHLNRWLKCF